MGCSIDTGRRGLEYLPDGRVVRHWAGGETVLCPSRHLADRLAMGVLWLGHIFDYKGPALPDTLCRYGFPLTRA